ncbi:helix-turn-helix domain-containing protein [Cohnella fermenti]|nr:helix-turn-helix domain-containing protein [Cohnella fermenti]
MEKSIELGARAERRNPPYPSALYVIRDCRREETYGDAETDIAAGGSYVLLAVAEGEGRARVDGLTYALGKNGLLAAEPGQRVTLHAASAIFAYYRLTFSAIPVPALEAGGAVAAPAGSVPSIVPSGPLACIPFSRCLEVCESVIRSGEEADEAKRYLHHVRFEELLRCLIEQNGGGSAESASDVRRAVGLTIERLKDRYMESLTVSQLAADARVPAGHYSKLFKELTGQIPLEYVNGLRIDRAKLLLRETNDRIHEIASQVGFASEFYFNRRFKQSVGMAPGRYRSQTRRQPRVTALFMEDSLLCLGITPIVQWAHPAWGTQEHLGLAGVPTFDVLRDEPDSLARFEPDLIIAKSEANGLGNHPLEQYERIAQTYPLAHRTREWKLTLRSLGSLLGREEQAEQAIARYDRKLEETQRLLSAPLRNRTYACLRLTAGEISVDREYSTPFLNGDLGLEPHPLVRELIFKAGREAVSAEWLAELDADYIFYTFDKWHEQGEGLERRQLLTPGWRAIPTVRSGGAFEVDFMVWMNQGYIANSRKLDDMVRLLK